MVHCSPISRLFRLLYGHVLEFVYPRSCVSCRTRLSIDESVVCVGCAYHLHLYRPNRYHAHERLWASPIFGSLFSPYCYEKGGHVQRMIIALKYHGAVEVASLIARTALLMCPEMRDVPYDYILAVPLEPKRRVDRGYNQSLLIAQLLARELHSNATDRLILRHHDSHTQTNLSRRERMINVRDAFYPSPDAVDLLRGRRILVVDDVLTTGSTLMAVLDLLEDLGVLHADVFTASVAI